MPIVEVTDLEALVLAGTAGVVAGLVDRARLDRVDAVGEAGRGAWLGMPVVDADVDAEVVAGSSRVVDAARIEKRTAHGVLAMDGGDRPAAVHAVVRVTKGRRQSPGDASVDRRGGCGGERSADTRGRQNGGRESADDETQMSQLLSGSTS